MRNNHRRPGDHLSDKITDQIREGLRSIVNRRVIRETKAQQIKRIHAELLRQRINVLAPLVGRRPGSEAMNKHERFCVTRTLHLVKYISILPGIAAPLTFQNCIELAHPALSKPVEKSYRSKRSPDHEAGGK